MSLQHIKMCQTQIRDLIKRDIDTNENFQSILPGVLCMRKITQYALNSGKRLRPMITWSMSNGSGTDFSLFIEYVHNSSLVVDDLPCMDNDNERRGVPTVHAKYGEYVAQLLAYNLMMTAMKHLSDGFKAIRKGQLYTQEQFDQISDAVNDEISNGLGFQGICGGQFLDLLICTDRELQNKSKREQRDIIIKIIKLKTGCLFGLSFVLGWIAMGKPIDFLDQIKEAGCGFGICYQIIDDLRDIEKDTEKNGGYNNICKYFSRNEIIDMFTDIMENFSLTMSQHELWNPTLHELYNYMLHSFKTEIRQTKG
jgi:geranylgeranyl diphosphate synthase type II